MKPQGYKLHLMDLKSNSEIARQLSDCNQFITQEEIHENDMKNGKEYNPVNREVHRRELLLVNQVEGETCISFRGCLLISQARGSSDYEIEFITGISPPPTIPTNCADLKYSLPLSRQSSYPVKAYLKFTLNNTVVTTGPNAFAKFSIESLDAVTKVTTGDSWLSSGGQLCQWGVQGLFPKRMLRKFFTMRCFNDSILTDFTTDRGVLTVDGLFHKHPNDDTPTNNRIYRIHVHLDDGTNITKDSNAFRIDPPAKGVEIVSQPPPSVEAQEKFNVSIRVVDKNNATLTQGADSCMFAEIQVYWTNDTSTFHHAESLTEIMYGEAIRMRGDNAVMKAAMYNHVIRNQLVDGETTFTDIELLDVTHSVKLNITTFMQSFPFSRRPDDYADLAGKVVEIVGGVELFYQNTSYPLSKAIALTQGINVTEQTATQIVILDKAGIKAKQGANFPIEDPIVIEVRDANDKRVYSGRDSALAITITTDPADACLSVDSIMTTSDGRAEFTGSICDQIASVTLNFAATSVISSSALIGDVTPSFQVTNEIHLGSFIDNKCSGSSNLIGSHVDSFSRFAADDMNADPNILPGRQIFLHSYDTKNSISETIKQYKSMMDSSKNDPSKKVRGVIGFGSNTLSLKMQPWLTQDKMPQIATREDKYEFGDKTLYPYYSRVSWEMGTSTHSVMMAAKSRGWTKGVVMRCMDYEISKVFYTKAKEFNIEFSEVSIPSVPFSQYGVHGVYEPELKKVKAAKTMIIWVFCLAPQFHKLIREAIFYGIAPIHGYQWVSFGLTAWHQPFTNPLPVCYAIEPLCSVALRGAANFASTYHLSGLRSQLWEPVLTRHIKKDRMFMLGTIPKHTLLVVTAEFALGYDAMLLFAQGLNQLVSQNKTISGETLSAAVRNVTVSGLTGTFSLKENGNRPGYRGFVQVTDPHPPVLGTPTAGVALIPRSFEIESDTAQHQLELKNIIQWPLSTYSVNTYTNRSYDPYNPYAMPNTTFMNRRIYNGSDGMLDGYEDLVPIPPSTTKPSLWVEIEEDVPAPVYCENGCGGNRTNRFDITQYENGDCVTINTCSCHDGYVGDSCDEMICICNNGYCDVPRTCICHAGWEGTKCDTAICANPCVNGKCTSPDVCTCDSGYTGSTCNSHYAVVVGIPVILFVLLLIAGVFFGRWFLKKQALKAALANLDWKVNWDEEVQTGVGAISMVSTAADDLMHSKKNYITWKSVRSYAQKYPCESLDVDDVGLRLEIVQLKELRHNNLIHFVGACLDSPNVSILTEPCPKGSLEDLLANDTVRLGWDFKYSLLKDICRGMDFLHKSEIGSHGRLKSTNCLVDNRWTCKITGFGIPTIRYKAPRKADAGKEEEMNSEERALFWTAPELLADAKTVDEVGAGTQAGDVYAFGIIMSEVISREEPYANELSFLQPNEVLMLVKNKDAPESAKAKRKWYESGGDTMKSFRPKIENSNLPDDYTAKTGLKKLVEVSWSDKAENRLSFRQNLDKLNEIHPIKGELIDNLVNMLEKYSSNLEAIVADRTKELSAEKAKTEMLISQMFPKSVAEDLKHGRSVEAESFECVTIFFSDLVGFTAIAKQSTPLQVVDLLNDLYTTFDAILDNYDVYKVETIGDAYMVVSGLPIRNGDLHAGEIATMSLDLLSSMCEFKIRHMPGVMLQLRIGMHSGPCVAGVVGLKMPRYCLFGDTVNTASRMESSSMALRIHMSEHTANILFRLGGYNLDCRGEREVKGKGTMTTYWLEGKDGFNKPLPTKEMAVSLSQHEFK